MLLLLININGEFKTELWGLNMPFGSPYSCGVEFLCMASFINMYGLLNWNAEN